MQVQAEINHSAYFGTLKPINAFLRCVFQLANQSSRAVQYTQKIETGLYIWCWGVLLLSSFGALVTCRCCRHQKTTEIIAPSFAFIVGMLYHSLLPSIDQISEISTNIGVKIQKIWAKRVERSTLLGCICVQHSSQGTELGSPVIVKICWVFWVQAFQIQSNKLADLVKTQETWN